MTDRYAVIGNPVHHSKSPWIHAAFAAQTGQDLSYEAVLGELDGFEGQVLAMARGGVRGLNVTLPFKERALALADRVSDRARLAGAANTLLFAAGGVSADNTDGIGLMRDLQQRLHVQLAGRRLLVIGAGGAVRGILGPLIAAAPAGIDLHNRTLERARGLAEAFSGVAGAVTLAALGAGHLARAEPYDLVINGTSASLAGELPQIPSSVFRPGAVAYDLAYRLDGPTPFLTQAQAAGAGVVADGLGMLVEQAAEAFLLWRGVRPETAPVLQALRCRAAG